MYLANTITDTKLTRTFHFEFSIFFVCIGILEVYIVEFERQKFKQLCCLCSTLLTLLNPFAPLFPDLTHFQCHF